MAADAFKIARCSDDLTTEKFDTLKRLITEINDIDQRDSDGYTLLHYAAKEDNFDVAELLLRNGANPDVTVQDPCHDDDDDDEWDDEGCVPLHFARKAIAKLLLGEIEFAEGQNWKATVDKPNAFGLTPFLSCVEHEDVNMARFFLRRAKNIRAGDSKLKYYRTGTRLAMKIAYLEQFDHRDDNEEKAKSLRKLIPAFANHTTEKAVLTDMFSYQKDEDILDQKPEVYGILLDLLRHVVILDCEQHKRKKMM